MMKVLTEASGSLVSGYLIHAIRDAGLEAVASDITADIAARELADDFILFPKASDPRLWDVVPDLLRKHAIDLVIPSLDATLLAWAEKRKEIELDTGCRVIVSPSSSVEIFQDKWKTFGFFCENDIPCPETSLEQDYELVKPRFGRGGAGISIPDNSVNMDGMISQKLLLGTEYTVDILCDAQGNPVYIVPRIRLNVRDGKSTSGVVQLHQGIVDWVRKICSIVKLVGPINMQCFVSDSGEINFVEVNPRIAGGMALGFAATENWISLLVSHFIENKAISPVPVKNGLRMMRYYAEVFVP